MKKIGNHNQIQQGHGNQTGGGINVLNASGGGWEQQQQQQGQMVGVPIHMPQQSTGQMNASAPAWQPGQAFVPMGQGQMMFQPQVDMNQMQQPQPPPPSSQQPTPLIKPEGPPKFQITDPMTGRQVGGEQTGGSNNQAMQK